MKPLTLSVSLQVVCRNAVELHPQVLRTAVQSSDVNCGPLSEVTSDDVTNPGCDECPVHLC